LFEKRIFFDFQQNNAEYTLYFSLFSCEKNEFCLIFSLKKPFLCDSNRKKQVFLEKRTFEGLGTSALFLPDFLNQSSRFGKIEVPKRCFFFHFSVLKNSFSVPLAFCQASFAIFTFFETKNARFFASFFINLSWRFSPLRSG
jgi:hypothetical protein